MLRNPLVFSSMFMLFGAGTALGQEAPSQPVYQGGTPTEELPPACPMPPPGQVQPPAAPPQAMAPPMVAPLPPPEHHRGPRFSPSQTSLSIGGGAANFIRERISDNASTAGAWDVRLNFGTRFPIGFEGGYLGTAQQANDPFVNQAV